VKPFWRTLKESCKGLGSVTLKINTQHTHRYNILGIPSLCSSVRLPPLLFASRSIGCTLSGHSHGGNFLIRREENPENTPRCETHCWHAFDSSPRFCVSRFLR
jgi:hypothetical protein